MHPELSDVCYALATDFALVLLFRAVVDDLMFPQLNVVKSQRGHFLMMADTLEDEDDGLGFFLFFLRLP